jgi:2-keto-3-deoxy-L-rhamnonate aldolase RhmA
MNKHDDLIIKFRERKQIISTNVVLVNSAPILELMNEDYLDCVILDMEHGIFNNENIVPMLQTARLIGLPAIVRVPEISSHHIARCMDLGALGIMAPRTETVEQVGLAVDSMFFPPIGKKGRGGYCQLRDGETIEDYQKRRFLVLQIESTKGISNLPAMLDKYGEQISAIVVGPYDLSVSLGICQQFEDPIFRSSVKKVFDICKEKGVSCGIFSDNIEQAVRWRAEGANFLWMCTEDQLILSGMHTHIKPLADI